MYGQWRALVKHSTEGEAQGTLPTESHQCSGYNLRQLRPASKLARDGALLFGTGGQRADGWEVNSFGSGDEDENDDDGDDGDDGW